MPPNLHDDAFQVCGCPNTTNDLQIPIIFLKASKSTRIINKLFFLVLSSINHKIVETILIAVSPNKSGR